MSRHLTRTQQEQILEITTLYLDSPGTGPGLKPVLDRLRAVIGAEGCMLTEVIPHVRQHVLARSGPWIPVETLIQNYPPHPLATHYARTGDSRVHTVDDVADSGWRRSPTYIVLRNLLDIPPGQCMRELAVPLRAPRGATRAFAMYRAGRDFGSSERLVGQRLQPILQRIDTHLQAVDRCQRLHVSPGTIASEAEVNLTPRELAVLVLLGDGSTAAAIGRRLSVSVSTVNTHLEHLYRKLGTNDRLTTVLRARELELIGTP